MKTVLAASVALFAIAAPSIASAEDVRYYDPAEGEFVTVTVNPGSGAAAAAAADAQRYTRTIQIYDPAEGEFAQIQVGETPAVIATHDAQGYQGPTKLYYDPAEGEFVEVPAN
jgi:hypothetical protein